MTKNLLLVLVLARCGAPFIPAYEGEPECGSQHAIHAQERALCDGSVQVACACDDRLTLECVNGLWMFRHDRCSAGLNVSTPTSP